MNATPTAVIGLGAMGLPMARHLAATFPVTAFDVSSERRALAVAAGAREAVTPAAAAREAAVVLLAVRDKAQVEAALFGEDGAAAVLGTGAVVILTSTVGPDAAREAAERLAARDILFVDAPVSGGPSRAEGDLLILAGAEQTAMEAAAPVLDRLASTLTVAGPRPGDGQSLKAINQLLAGVHIAAAAEAIALGRSLGLDPDAVVGSLKHGAAGSFMFADRGPRMAAQYRDENVEVRSRLDIFVKDLGIVTGIARDGHVPAPLAAAAYQLYLLAAGAGLAAQDDSSVVTLLSPPDSAP